MILQWEKLDIKGGLLIKKRRKENISPDSYLIVTTNFGDSHGPVYAAVSFETGEIYSGWLIPEKLAELLTKERFTL